MLPESKAESDVNGNSTSAGVLTAACPLPLSDYQEIVLAHGSGGKLSQQLIQDILLPQFGNDLLDVQHDGAVFAVNGARLAFSTDSFVVSPIFFPGGDIGKLAIQAPLMILRCAERARFICRWASFWKKAFRCGTSGRLSRPCARPQPRRELLW